MQATFLRKIPPLYIFIALLAIVSCIYNYPVILFHRPYSIHLWRQCDCLSMALMYYENGMHFFSPAVHWCGLNGNGNAAPGECTWIYYTVAILWKVFGYHEFIYRLFDMAILYAGLIALYKTAAGILNSHYWGMIVSLFLFSSAIVAYYGNNFIPDPTALSLALIAWYFFYRYSVTNKNISLIFSMLFFGIAGATKVTALISFVPIVFAFFAEKFNIISFKKDDKLFKGTLLPIALFVLALAPIGLWIAFSIHYNNQNNAGLFGSHILPIWELNAAQIKPIKANLYFGEMSDLFLDRLGFKIFLLLFIYSIFNYKRASRFLLFLTIFITFGAIAYILLWFQVFDVHDYYLINVLVW
ncbi:MAG TPA: glycosyltransferase family 39 protein, partial [Bacteroidia bacterium]|nr:glycosyltransferase family 39 protein [Bacteroidia bacterium]